MAKLQYGPIVTSASGKVAGVVFSIWKGVQYAKRWVKPTYTNTTAQQNIRNAFKTLTIIWKYLNSDVVLAWTNYAKGKGMANRNAWIGQNVKDYAAATMGVGTPHNPEKFPPTGLTCSHATAGLAQIHFTWPSGYTTNDKAYTFWIRKVFNNDSGIGSATYPATTIAFSGLYATTFDFHTFLAATLDHKRSMSVGKRILIS